MASQDPLNILGSLVVQLAESFPSILESILPLYEVAIGPKVRRTSVDIASLEDAVVKHTLGDKPVVLLVDAINESSHAENLQRSLIKLVRAIPNLRVVVTGTSAIFPVEHATILNLDAAIMKEDINTFTRSVLQKDRVLRNLSTELKDHIWTTIVEGADGS